MKREIDPQSWFGTREIKGPVPKHFVKTSTEVSEESYIWIIKKFISHETKKNYFILKNISKK